MVRQSLHRNDIASDHRISCLATCQATLSGASASRAKRPFSSTPICHRAFKKSIKWGHRQNITGSSRAVAAATGSTGTCHGVDLPSRARTRPEPGRSATDRLSDPQRPASETGRMGRPAWLLRVSPVEQPQLEVLLGFETTDTWLEDHSLVRRNQCTWRHRRMLREPIDHRRDTRYSARCPDRWQPSPLSGVYGNRSNPGGPLI